MCTQLQGPTGLTTAGLLEGQWAQGDPNLGLDNLTSKCMHMKNKTDFKDLVFKIYIAKLL